MDFDPMEMEDHHSVEQKGFITNKGSTISY